MSKTREKSIAFVLLCLIVGVLHFFFGRTILSAVLYVVEIGLFWIIGAVVALCFIVAVIAAIFDVDNLKKAEKWLDLHITEDDECDCDCDECDCDDEDCEYHVEIRCKRKKSNECECSCNSEDGESEEEVEDVEEEVETVEEANAETTEEETSESDDEIEK